MWLSDVQYTVYRWYDTKGNFVELSFLGDKLNSTFANNGKGAINLQEK